MPTLTCPACGEPAEFHEDEVDAVEDGEAFCLSCRLEIQQNGFFMGLLGGEHEELVEQMIGEEDE